MREKYNTLKITDLRSIVKGMGIKGTSAMNKEELVDILVEKEKEYNGVTIKEKEEKKPAPVAEVSEPAPQVSEEKEYYDNNLVVFGAPGFEQEYDPRLDSNNTVTGIVEVMQDGFGFIRSDN